MIVPPSQKEMDRYDVRVAERSLRRVSHEINSAMASVRAERRDLGDLVFVDPTETRALLQGAIEHLAEAVTALDEARRRLP